MPCKDEVGSRCQLRVKHLEVSLLLISLLPNEFIELQGIPKIYFRCSKFIVLQIGGSINEHEQKFVEIMKKTVI